MPNDPKNGSASNRNKSTASETAPRPQSPSSRHIYFSQEEYSKFLRGVPIERETDGLELTVFPPERASLPVAIEGLREYAEFLEERDQ